MDILSVIFGSPEKFQHLLLKNIVYTVHRKNQPCFSFYGGHRRTNYLDNYNIATILVDLGVVFFGNESPVIKDDRNKKASICGENLFSIWHFL